MKRLLFFAVIALSATAHGEQPPSVKTLALPITGAKRIGLVYVAPGKFHMGREVGLAEKFGPQRLGSDESPVRKVTITRGYYIAKHKVTCAQFCRFLDAHPDPEQFVSFNRFSRLEKAGDNIVAKPGCDDSAVNVVHWAGAEAFCRWLSVETGRDVRLPTEAQWEFAARGTASRRYPWGDQPKDDAVPEIGPNAPPWSCDAVNAYPTNSTPEGVIGMVGLEGEWCQDYYGAEYLPNDTVDPRGPMADDLPVRPANPLLAASEGKWRVLRGTDLAPLKPLATLRTLGLKADDAGIYGVRVVVIPPAE
jgi:formylglycine-generating enzyme required for sulfatase activity